MILATLTTALGEWYGQPAWPPTCASFAPSRPTPLSCRIPNLTHFLITLHPFLSVCRRRLELVVEPWREGLWPALKKV